MRYRKQAIPQAVRRAVALRNGAKPGHTTIARCHYCGREGHIYWPRLSSGRPGAWVTFPDFDLDHVLAEFNGGSTTDAANFVLACARCNRSKGHRHAEPIWRSSGSVPERVRNHSGATHEDDRTEVGAVHRGKGMEGNGREWMTEAGPPQVQIVEYLPPAFATLGLGSVAR